MLRRVVAAVLAVVLAVIAAVLVIRYANSADERALEGLESRSVLVLTEQVPEGTPVSELAEKVQLREIPAAGLPGGTVDDLGDLDADFVTTAVLAEGEPLTRVRLASAADARAAGEVPLPEGTEDLHQVTLLLDKARALGGNIATGDKVGVFMSFDIQDTDESDGTSAQNVSTTHLTLHQVSVVRVEGATLVPDESEDQQQPTQEQVFVTLALEAHDAERLVFGAEWGEVWLSMEPDNAERDTEIVVARIPIEAEDVYE